MSLTTLIVDDEPVARKVLREELESFADVEIVGEADDGPTALARIARDQPDLVFLDLQMPVMGGLDVVRSLKGGARVPVIVIVTAYDRFALEAFEAGALDYLLKPIGHARLAEALERVKRLSGRQTVERLARLQDLADTAAGTRKRRIVGRAGQEFFLLNADEIHAFQADGAVVRIITANRTFEATQSLKILEQRLKDSGFRRIHRNAMVNIDHVRKMSALSSQRWLITLANGLELMVSKRQARSVRELLHW
jgi:two-component system, LytTR family, response regulator